MPYCNRLKCIVSGSVQRKWAGKRCNVCSAVEPGCSIKLPMKATRPFKTTVSCRPTLLDIVRVLKSFLPQTLYSLALWSSSNPL